MVNVQNKKVCKRVWPVYWLKEGASTTYEWCAHIPDKDTEHTLTHRHTGQLKRRVECCNYVEIENLECSKVRTMPMPHTHTYTHTCTHIHTQDLYKFAKAYFVATNRVWAVVGHRDTPCQAAPWSGHRDVFERFTGEPLHHLVAGRVRGDG